MKQVSVCPLHDLPDGSMRMFHVDGRELVFVRNGEQVFALRDICPHQGARLSLGLLSCRRIAGDVGDYRTEGQLCVVRCPWHNWEFDIADGTSTHDPARVRVATYRAFLADGQVYVVL
jgi:nitrite reductase/ring-hydroxylating ferredoxin subunit